MQQLTNFCTLVLLITLIYSCQDSKAKTTTKVADVIEVKKEQAKPPFKGISKDTFDSWVARWNDNYRAYMASDSLHYFDMPLVDLNEMISEPAADSARFYMGMETGDIPHLMLVGINKGKSIYTSIADYSNACPPKCSNGNGN